MGLDMYLEARRYVWASGHAVDSKISATIKEILPELSVMDIKGVTFEAAYWRKANAIHQWMVDNIQDGKDDCGHYYVSNEQLEKLADLCDEVLEEPERAGELLPTTSGFFFGGTEYGEYYFSQLKYTRDRLRELLDNEHLSKLDFYYHSSW
jgi:hypothetical protein